MATYPIKMLKDDEGNAFVPLVSASSVFDSNNVALQTLLSGKYDVKNNLTTASAGIGVLDAYQGKILNDKFVNYIPTSEKGTGGGVATLDSDGKVLSSQLPSYIDGVMDAYIVPGETALSATWLSATDGGQPLTPSTSRIYVILTPGGYQNQQYRWSGSTYVLSSPTDVLSVNGMTGVVTLNSLTIQKNGTTIGTAFNGTNNQTINITVPTTTNDLTNNSGFITASDSITGNAATATTASSTVGTLTIQKNGTNVATFNGTNATANIVVPVIYTGAEGSIPSSSLGSNGDLYLELESNS